MLVVVCLVQTYPLFHQVCSKLMDWRIRVYSVLKGMKLPSAFIGIKNSEAGAASKDKKINLLAAF